jgi:hypothetical protein
MNKEGMFKEITAIMSKDYSGYLDKKELNHPEQYRISDGMSDEEFMKEVRSYLLDFKDHHVQFICKANKDYSNGFTVRRYENRLYVTELLQETQLSLGDAIISIDDIEIETKSRLHSKELSDGIYERQNWKSVLKGANKCLIDRDGETFEFRLHHYEISKPAPVYSYQQLDPLTCIITLSDFNNEQAIRDILDQHRKDIVKCRNLIFDVRRNGGGMDSAYFPLLPFIFPKKVMLSDLFEDGDYPIVNCTQRNCNLRSELYRSYLQMGLDDFTKQYITRELEFYQENYGKGLVVSQIFTQRKDINFNGAVIGENISIFKKALGKPISDKNGEAHFKYKDIFLLINYDIQTGNTICAYFLKEDY